MNIFKKNYIKRAIRTFCQTAIGYIAINLPLIDFTENNNIIKSTIIGLGVSAISAGLSAIMNLKEN